MQIWTAACLCRGEVMRSFEEIPDIAERIKRSKMELQESGFYLAPEWDSQSCCDQDYVNNFKKGWESRQTEVDELQKQRDSFIKAYEIEMDERVELQKRVDAVTEVLGDIKDGMAGESLDIQFIGRQLERALKGESNESST